MPILDFVLLPRCGSSSHAPQFGNPPQRWKTPRLLPATISKQYHSWNPRLDNIGSREGGCPLVFAEAFYHPSTDCTREMNSAKPGCTKRLKRSAVGCPAADQERRKSYFATTLTTFGLACSAFGMLTLSTPFCSIASTLPESTESGN